MKRIASLFLFLVFACAALPAKATVTCPYQSQVTYCNDLCHAMNDIANQLLPEHHWVLIGTHCYAVTTLSNSPYSCTCDTVDDAWPEPGVKPIPVRSIAENGYTSFDIYYDETTLTSLLCSMNPLSVGCGN